jgi:hypothetical protein
VLVDENSPHSHIQNADLSIAELVFISPIAVSVLQSVDMDITKSFRDYFRQLLVLHFPDLREWLDDGVLGLL